MSSSEAEDSVEQESEFQARAQNFGYPSVQAVEPCDDVHETTAEMCERSPEKQKMSCQSSRTVLSPARFTYRCGLTCVRKAEAVGIRASCSSYNVTPCCSRTETAIKRKYEESLVVNMPTDDEQEELLDDKKEREGEVLIFKVESTISVYSHISKECMKNIAGMISLYDCEDEAAGLQSRVEVHSLQGSGIMLNRKVCSSMVVTRHTHKTVCLTAPVTCGQHKAFWFTTSPLEADLIFHALSDRVDKERSNMGCNYLTRYAANLSSAKRRSLNERKDDEDHLDPAELD